MVELESQNKALKQQQMLSATNRVGIDKLAEPLSAIVGSSTIGSGLLSTNSLLQLAYQQQQWREIQQLATRGIVRGTGGTNVVDLAQLSRYMKGQNGSILNKK